MVFFSDSMVFPDQGPFRRKAIPFIHSLLVSNRLLLESPAVQQSFGFLVLNIWMSNQDVWPTNGTFTWFHFRIWLSTEQKESQGFYDSLSTSTKGRKWEDGQTSLVLDGQVGNLADDGGDFITRVGGACYSNTQWDWNKSILLAHVEFSPYWIRVGKTSVTRALPYFKTTLHRIKSCNVAADPTNRSL